MAANLLDRHNGANELTGQVHTRMPVILHERDYDRWLARGTLHGRRSICCGPTKLMPWWPTPETPGRQRSQ